MRIIHLLVKSPSWNPVPATEPQGHCIGTSLGLLGRLVNLMLEGVRLRWIKGLRAPQKRRTDIGIPVDPDQCLGT